MGFWPGDGLDDDDDRGLQNRWGWLIGARIGSFDATVRLWDCKSQSHKPIQVFEESKDSVSSLHVAGHEIVTGCVDGRMRLYDLRMGMVYVDLVGRTCRAHPDVRCTFEY